MKKKRFLVYFLSIIIPIVIFFVMSYLNKYVPLGNEQLNSYDSFTQYPGILLEYANLLKSGNIFYSWKGGLGFNFLGTITYYGMSPLNLLVIFANSSNYYLFIAFMTFLRFGLLGLSMCFYLEHKNINSVYIVLLSVTYALMGYTSAYYYNYIWIDSIIMLPFVIHGLDKLMHKESPRFYIISLTIAILINYYIGYMICIFSVIWFLYKIINIQDKKQILRTFFISSLLSGLMSMIVILPSMFALMTGKSMLFSKVNYMGINNNMFTFLYTLTSGSFRVGDQINGPAIVYSSILAFVCSIFTFFNTNFKKREKIATFIVILFFYLSFSVNFLNYAWQFFQKPIWWPSRFSFTFSFFLIALSARVLTNIDKTDFKLKYRLIITGCLLVGMIGGAFIKWKSNTSIQLYTYLYLGFSILILLEMMFLLDKKGFLPMLIVFTFIELSLNTFNSLKNNFHYRSYTNHQYIKDDLPVAVKKLNKENEYFYRMELKSDYTSNDGMYFNFNGINYFNSVRNIHVTNLFKNLGVRVHDDCHIVLEEFDPVILSLFNIKYLYGGDYEYLIKKDKSISENPHPLALGFMTNDAIKDYKLKENGNFENRNNIINSMFNHEINLYKTILKKDFDYEKKDYFMYYTYSFTSDGHYLLMANSIGGSITINDEVDSISNGYKEIYKGDKIIVKYTFAGDFEDKVNLHLLDLEKYDEIMDELESNILKAKTNINGHILEGSINVTKEKNYLFTSIEYEQGMRVYVDDKEIKPDILLNALIGFELTEGEHKIIIDYVPKGLKSGIIISILSLGSTIFYLNHRRKSLNRA